MQTIVSRGTMYDDQGQRLCSRCGRRPPTRRRYKGKGRPQSWCNPCHAEYQRERRAGMIQVLLTPDEWAAVKTARRAERNEARGRHRAGRSLPG